MKICPECGKLLDLDVFYGAYICSCGFMSDNSFHKERREKFLQMVTMRK